MESTNKSKKKNIPKSINEMSKEVLQETLRKKKECNAKALLTVEKLCETQVTEEWLLENLQYINQCHFEDATVERAITKLCGYPLCIQKLDKVPSQQYHISTRYNKVFDITERKNFCSSSCYKAAMYIKKQLFTSPLWFRDQEVIPKYVVLKSSKSSLGEEVVFFPDKIHPEQDDVKTEKKYVGDDGISDIENKCSNLSLEEMGSSKTSPTNMNNNDKDNSMASGSIKESQKAEQVDLKEIRSDVADIQNDALNNGAKNVNDSALQQNLKTNTQLKELNSSSNMSEHVINTDTQSTKLENKPSVNSQIKNVKDKKPQTRNEPVDCVTKVESSIFEWFSIDTMLHLFSEVKLKEMFSEKKNEFKEILNAKPRTLDCDKKIDKMLKLFDLLDIEYFSDSENKMNLKPLPDYSVLKEEGKKLEIKVRAFYNGDFNIKDVPKDENEVKKDTTEENNPIYLPLVDAHAQQALRRKIVLDKLNKILPELIRIFSIDYILQMSEIRILVSSFSLGPHNITFKPSEWYLVGLILIKLLSFKDRYLELILELESSQKQMALLLMSFGLPQDYLNNIVQKLTSTDNVIKKLNTDNF